MASRWIVAAVFLLAAQPAIQPAWAQLSSDPDNPDAVLPDPKPVSHQAVPPSQEAAEQAVVSPATSSARPKEKSASSKSACDPSNPCATETPEGR